MLIGTVMQDGAFVYSQAGWFYSLLHSLLSNSS